MQPNIPPKKASAERDALLQALQLAETEVIRARAAQKTAEAKLTELNEELYAARGKADALQPSSRYAISQAQAAQKRAEARTEVLEAQLRGQQMELEALQTDLDEVKADNQRLRSQVRAQDSQLKAQQKEVEDSRAEVLRMRSVLAGVSAQRGKRAA